MPAVTCPTCRGVAELPADWPDPSYKCPFCETVVRLENPPLVRRAGNPEAPAASPPVGHGESAFMTMFGGAIGFGTGCVVFVAGLIVLLILGVRK